MKLISVLDKLNNFEFLNSYSDGMVVYSKDFSSFYKEAFSTCEIKKILSMTNKQIIIDMSFMMENKDEKDVECFIDEFKDFENAYFMFIDLGIFEILKEKGKETKAIYNPQTLITNHFDMNFYQDFKMAIALSLEITLNDQETMLERTKGDTFMKVFGYQQMFHSKRHLLSVFKQHSNLDFKIDNKKTYLKEQTRQSLFPIVETKHGTLIYRSYLVNYLFDLDRLKNLTYAFLDNIFLNEETYKDVIKLYFNVLKGNISLSLAKEELNKLNLNIEDGFKYQDSIYLKEEIKCQK